MRDGRWDLLLICVAGFILVSVGRLHQLFPALLPLQPALVTGTLAIALYLADRTPIRQAPRAQGRALSFLLAFLVWSGLSVPGALWPGGSLQVFIDLTKTVLMCFLTIAAVRSARDVERLAFVYFAAAVIFAALALLRFGPGEGRRFERLYYYDSNDFATFAVTALPLGIHFIFGQRRIALRLAACIGVWPLVVAFVRSGSRGGFIALLAAAAFFLFRHSSIPTWRRVTGILVLLLIFSATAGDTYWERMRTMLHAEEDYNLMSPYGRWQIWRRGVGYMLQYPVFGVGAGNFETAEGRLSPLAKLQERGLPLKWSAPHDSYLQVGVETGVPGLLLFVGFLVSCFAALRTVERATGQPGAQVRGPPELAQALMASLTGFVVGAFFLSLAYQGMLYTLVALALGLQKVTTGAVLRTASTPGQATGILPSMEGSSRGDKQGSAVT
jgi:O-antigen ligase